MKPSDEAERDLLPSAIYGNFRQLAIWIVLLHFVLFLYELSCKLSRRFRASHKEL